MYFYELLSLMEDGHKEANKLYILEQSQESKSVIMQRGYAQK